VRELQHRFYELRGEPCAVDDWLDLQVQINEAIREVRVRAREREASSEAARDSPRRVAAWAAIGDAFWITSELNALALNVEHELDRLGRVKSAQT
jgi:hypothetical protein